MSSFASLSFNTCNGYRVCFTKRSEFRSRIESRARFLLLTIVFCLLACLFRWTGLCQDGDDCPYLHRTAGDTERRYHLRYYKTAPCVHETDARGFCVKNGVHCAFAHGNTDLRNPVYDIRDLRVRFTHLGQYV